jgi:hypothetical protein
MSMIVRCLPSLFGLVYWLWPCVSPAADAPAKPRLVVLTDIGGDPDDQQSLIRLMLYSNESKG